MKRQIKPRHGQAQSLCHRGIHQREADGNSEASIEHLVEIAVPWVVVVFLIPAKLFLDEKDPVYLADDLASIGAGLEAGACTICELIDSCEISLDIDLGIGIAADFERDASKVDTVAADEQALKLGTVRKRRRHGRAPHFGPARILTYGWAISGDD